MPPDLFGRVTAVVLTWNTADMAVRTLESLGDAFAAGMRLVLIDNGSVDDSVPVIQTFLEGWQHSGAVTFARSETNLGFPGGVNFGTDIALGNEPQPEFIWMLNPDAEVSESTIRTLLRTADESGAGIVGVSGSAYYPALNSWSRVFYLPPRFRRSKRPKRRSWWPAASYGGSCSLFRTSFVNALIETDGHFLDGSLFLDWDEWDCVCRARRQGVAIVLSGEERVEHDDSARTFGPSPMAAARQYYQSRNAIVVSRRHMHPALFWGTLPLHLARDLSWFARLRVQGVRPNERAYVMGALDGLRGRSGRWRHHPASPSANR